MNGILIIDKKKGITSRDVVNKVVKIFNTKKVGHTGTLDPLATGVLVLCVGSATKLVNRLTSTEKEYIASCTLGIETDTLDSEGKVLSDENCIRLKEEIDEVLKRFKTTYNQQVPYYSAVKVNGKKLYEYAREGIKVKLPKKRVTIYDIEMLDYKIDNEKTKFSFRCKVSKGTYIRSLIRDIALLLDTNGIMTDLRRIKQGEFDIKDAIKEENIDINSLISIKDVLDVKKIELNSKLEKAVLNGASIEFKEEVLFLKNDIEIALYKDGKCQIMFRGGNL